MRWSGRSSGPIAAGACWAGTCVTACPGNHWASPDPQDITKDISTFMSIWSPGQHVVPGVLEALGLSLGHAVIATVAVFSVIGLLGWWVLYRAFGFSAACHRDLAGADRLQPRLRLSLRDLHRRRNPAVRHRAVVPASRVAAARAALVCGAAVGAGHGGDVLRQALRRRPRLRGHLGSGALRAASVATGTTRCAAARWRRSPSRSSASPSITAGTRVAGRRPRRWRRSSGRCSSPTASSS